MADGNCVRPTSVPSIDFPRARCLSTCFLTGCGRDDITLVEFFKPRNDGRLKACGAAISLANWFNKLLKSLPERAFRASFQRDSPFTRCYL